MNPRPWAALAPLFLFLGSVTQAELPPDQSTAFATAVSPSDTAAFAGSYTMKTTSTVRKANGKTLEDMVLEMAVSCDPETGERRRLLRFLVNGEDVTDERRGEIEGHGHTADDQESDSEDESGSMSMTLVAPFGGDVEKFQFGQPRPVGELIELDFQPRENHRKDDWMASGTLIWHAESGDPVSATYQVLDPPYPAKEMSLTTFYRRVGDTVYMTKITSDGLVKLLLMKRIFHMEMEWSEIQASEPSVNGSVLRSTGG